MKRYIIILALGVSTLFSSCNSKLDLPNDGRISLNEVFNDKNMTRGYLNYCYYGILAVPGFEAAGFTDEAQDVDAVAQSSSNYGKWYDGSFTVNDFGALNWSNSNMWSRYYQGIRRCNLFLNRVENLGFSVRDVELEGWKAQAYTLRALYYLQLIKLFGGVPLILEDRPIGADYASDTRATFNEVVSAIIADCEMALSMSSETVGGGFSWVISGPTDGNIMWRAVPYAIMSQAITYAVSPRWNDGTFTMAYATEITKKALDECLRNGLRLFDVAPTGNTSQNAYAEYHLRTRYTDQQRQTDKESIVHLGNQFAVWSQSGLPTTESQVKAGTCPTQEIVDSYEMQATGEPPILGYNANHTSATVNPAAWDYNPNDPYVGRDPRFYASIYYNGARRYLDDRTTLVETFVGGAEGISETSRRFTRTGYYLRKFNSWQSRNNDNRDGSIRLMRLAELYLNFAECAYQSAGPDVQVQSTVGGQAMSAREAVNAVRARAGMPDFPPGMSREAFETKYRNERKVELAFEGHRWFDIRRWNILADVERYVSGMRITRSGSTYTFTRFNFTRASNTDKFYLFPLPQTEVDKMQILTGTNWQNPGWSQ